MKIVVIGGSGLIGSKLVANLTEQGRQAVPASLQSGVNTLTGEGLTDAVAGAAVVVDVSNSPSFEDDAVMEFFTTSTRNLLAAETTAGVGHHVALSVVGADRLPDSGYLRAKVAQERAIQAGPVPFTILRSSQFFEFVTRIADTATRDGAVWLPPALMRPVAADDVAIALTAIAQDPPRKAIVEIAGPQSFPLDELAGEVLQAHNDPRVVRTDAHARYFGTEIDDASLRPGTGARSGRTKLADWLEHHVLTNCVKEHDMSKIHVTVVSPEEAYNGNAEFWCDRDLMAVTVLEDGQLQLRIDPRRDGLPWLIETTSLAAGLAEASRRIVSY